MAHLAAPGLSSLEAPQPPHLHHHVPPDVPDVELGAVVRQLYASDLAPWRLGAMLKGQPGRG